MRIHIIKYRFNPFQLTIQNHKSSIIFNKVFYNSQLFFYLFYNQFIFPIFKHYLLFILNRYIINIQLYFYHI
jgi:hypothetical protein